MNGEKFLGYKEKRFLLLSVEGVDAQQWWRHGKKGDGDVVFMAFMVLCHFFYLGWVS